MLKGRVVLFVMTVLRDGEEWIQDIRQNCWAREEVPRSLAGYPEGVQTSVRLLWPSLHLFKLCFPVITWEVCDRCKIAWHWECDIWIHRGFNIFQAFTSYLKSKKVDDQSKEELVKELAALDEHLKTKVHRHSFFLHWNCAWIYWRRLELQAQSGLPGNLLKNLSSATT